MKDWLSIACRASIVTRAMRVALIVGTILTVINQGDLIMSGAWSIEMCVKIVLTYCVPYAVSTYAAVEAVKEAR